MSSFASFGLNKSLALNALTKLWGLVVAGNFKSLIPTTILSSSFFLPTSLSEQTAKLRIPNDVCWVHSSSVWLSNARLGTRNNTFLPRPASSSAIRKEVKVLPVPQAIISLPRSASANPYLTADNAGRWWSLKLFFLRNIGFTFESKLNCDQSIKLPSKSNNEIVATGGFASTKDDLALSVQSSVEATI